MLSLNLIVFTCFFLFYTDEVFGKTDYCKFTPKHLLCGGARFHSRCEARKPYIYTDITENQIEILLGNHNNYRNEIALGRMKGGKGKLFPEASNMEELKWDGELANLAAAMVKECRFAHICLGASKCSRTDRIKSIGGNIYAKSSENVNKTLLNDTTLEHATRAWFMKEKDFYDTADVPKYRSGKNSMGKNWGNYGHFTQMIWWGTLRIGCARIVLKFTLLVTCIYAPPGNVAGSTIYQIGKPCSNCTGQGRTCSKKYKGLCAADGRPNDPDPDPSNVLGSPSSGI